MGRHHPLGIIPTGHRWDRIAMDILDVCDPTTDGHRYILVIADYFSQWTEVFPMKNKCANSGADLLVENSILRFGMPLVIHSDQGREFENGLMTSVCALLGCTKTRTPTTCLMSMFVNDRRDNWHKLLPFVMHAYRTSVHESTGYSPFRLMTGEECSLPQDVSTAELVNTTFSPHLFATWVRDALEVAYDHVRESLHRTAARGCYVITPQLLSTSWALPGLDLIKSLCPGPQDISWVPGVPAAKSLCASTVAFQPGSRVSDTTPDPSVDVSVWEDMSS